VPQFDPSVFASQLIWLAAIFAFLYFAVVRPTLPKVGRVIDEREGKVAGDLDAAETAKHEADAIRTRYDEGMASAREAAQGEVAKARDAAAKKVETQMKALGETLDAQAADAADKLAKSRVAAQKKLAATATELTGEAVKRLIGVEVPAAEIEAALAATK
jgi:F-type H+-transporting ATPase subunit b